MAITLPRIVPQHEMSKIVTSTATSRKLSSLYGSIYDNGQNQVKLRWKKKNNDGVLWEKLNVDVADRDQG